MALSPPLSERGPPAGRGAKAACQPECVRTCLRALTTTTYMPVAGSQVSVVCVCGAALSGQVRPCAGASSG